MFTRKPYAQKKKTGMPVLPRKKNDRTAAMATAHRGEPEKHLKHPSCKHARRRRAGPATWRGKSEVAF